MRLAPVLAILLMLPASFATAAEEAPIYHESGSFRLLGDGPGYLHLAAGEFDFGNKYTSAGATIELRFGRKLGFVGPAAGVMVNEDGGIMGYAGLYADMVFWKRLTLTPFCAAGVYSQGDSLDLGGTFEMRSAVTLAWLFEGGMRLGMTFAHVSNGGIYDRNPGENELMVGLSIPLSRFH